MLSFLKLVKPIILKIILIYLEDTTLLCIWLWILYKIFNASGTEKSKISKTNDMKACWFLEHTFLCLTILLEETLRIVYPTLKSLVLSSTSGETPVKSTHECFPFTHPYTRIFVGLCVDLSSCRPVKNS